MAAFVYLLRCADGTLYCGWTTDVEARATVHNAGSGARYTRGRRPVAVVWQEECVDRSAALKRELRIKRLSRRAKEALIASAQVASTQVGDGGAQADAVGTVRVIAR